MIVELFKEARVAVSEQTAIAQQHAHGQALIQNALFPLKGSFYIYPDNNKQSRDEPMASSDQAGVLLVINDLFMREPERFGSSENRKIIQRRCADLFQAFEDKKTLILKDLWAPNFTQLVREKKQLSANLFSDIAQIFNDHCPDALKGISIALVGLDSADSLRDYIGKHHAVFTPENHLLAQFASVYDFYPGRGHGGLSLAAIESDYSDTKVDYVITGNVLNDTACTFIAHDIFLASARLLKQGGRAIHLLGYSNDNYDLHADNPALIALAGQQRIAALPMTFVKAGFEGDYHRAGCKDFIVFEQTRPIDLTHIAVGKIIGDGLTDGRHLAPYIEADGAQLPAKLARLASLADSAVRFESLR